ncbi:hypothetical protein D1818_24175 [Aquimarina sp. BL5]|uniref:hypothetical protein n=1 Tax=Aquimarina sp. BL5 TaxID=1714860 RepID=UPI000E548635|nr:hypothetical protein [Aquimarina sp. BL5]AXT53767.1 hypothetical protein D1818_24175 [Aquimarina sp. BL5]RKN03430.1 hypothetical protein D7036_13850 [Aquimarina sp. BL5]
MKKLLYIFIFLGLTSCDDGDIIVTSFEFEDVDLQLCQGAKPNEFVFFKINTSVNEAISYNFIDATYSATTVTENPIIIDLENLDNGLIYRKFNTAITSDYYCNNIPDSNITVTEELLSVSGIATINNQIISEDDNDGVESTLEAPNEIDPEADPDGDGVPNYLDDAMNDNSIRNTNQTADNPLGIEEGYNSDDDQIPDFRDQDDDNDNVLTSVELPNDDPNDDTFLDTDGDDIPNYKDPDDDGDGILTRDEDIDGNGNPRDDDSDNDGIANFLDNDDDDDGIPTKEEDTNNNGNPLDDDDDMDGVPNYLDSDLSDGIANANADNPSILDNTVITIFRTTLAISDLILNEVNDQFTNDDFSFGFRDQTISITTPKNED